MTCSVLIPSRRRFDGLLRVVRSVILTSGNKEYEIIVRLHDDDAGSLARKYELKEFKMLRLITGETLTGYTSLNSFCQELIEQAEGDWLWILNDDMEIHGENWCSKLQEIPTEALVQPEIHKLNNCSFLNNVDGPAPIFPRNALKRCGRNSLGPGSYDAEIYQFLVTDNGFPVRFLPGITVWHDWHGHE